MFDGCCSENASFPRNFGDKIFGGHVLIKLHKNFQVAVNHKKKVVGPRTIVRVEIKKNFGKMKEKLERLEVEIEIGKRKMRDMKAEIEKSKKEREDLERRIRKLERLLEEGRKSET